MLLKKRHLLFLIFAISLVACNDSDQGSIPNLDKVLEATIRHSTGQSSKALILPQSHDLKNIPQDPNNVLTPEKVALGQLLFHETALATNPNNSEHLGSFSCASCHHAAAGFKAGVAQGIGEGGQGFGVMGEGRVLGAGFDIHADDPRHVPDIQPFASPATLNVAYQEVMLWNGQFGHQSDGVINQGLALEVLATENTPKKENARGLSGLETQAIAGLGVHRLVASEGSILQTNEQYQQLFEKAYPQGSDDLLRDAGKAIAAFERTILATQAPFQRWLRGESAAMNDQEKRGAIVFFGEGRCHQCHQGPALSSALGASEAEMFFAVGFADFDLSNPQIHSAPTEKESLGRGGFTNETEDNYKFKIPQLYNLASASVYGHGASFRSIREVVSYKNQAVPQKTLPFGTLDERMTPLGLSEEQIDDLTAFLTTALFDPNLSRYTPPRLPSGQCAPNNDPISRLELSEVFDCSAL